MRPAPTTPSQLTSRLMPPRKSRAAAMAAFTSDSEVTSHLRNVALAPSFDAAACPGASCTSSITTLPPLAATCCATAFPRPEAPPVTTARASLILMPPLTFCLLHSEDAVTLGFWRGTASREMQRQTQDPTRVEWIDYTVIPKARCGVIRMALPLIVATDFVHETFLLLCGDFFTPYGREHLRRLLPAHYRNTGVG